MREYGDRIFDQLRRLGSSVDWDRKVGLVWHVQDQFPAVEVLVVASCAAWAPVSTGSGRWALCGMYRTIS